MRLNKDLMNGCPLSVKNSFRKSKNNHNVIHRSRNS